MLIGIADVDRYVPKGSAIDQYAAQETVTIYTGVKNFSMLPEALSTGLTSLLEQQDRACMVTEFVLDANVCATESCVSSSRIYPAVVRNKAQLAYPSVGAWLGGKAEAPARCCRVRRIAGPVEDAARDRAAAARGTIQAWRPGYRHHGGTSCSAGRPNQAAVGKGELCHTVD